MEKIAGVSERLGRTKTAIPGLDEITHGGIPKGSRILITGTAGSGKTVLGSQFLYLGSKEYKEPSVFLSFEESTQSIRKNAMNFGWDFGPLEKEGKFAFAKYDPYHVDEVPNILEAKIREIDAKRIVIDSLSALSFFVRDESDFRRLVLSISKVLEKLDCTSLLVSEIVPGSPGISRNGIEEFLVDGVIVLYYRRVGSSFSRAIQVWKMRGTDHSEKLHPYKITKTGIQIYPKEEALMGMK
ncbi:MAG: AAA family ATPase [Candidatus Aenigmarchaeota archaeon]|nr:AAA family ATPase [Candidatus Aenigmarchaeota archaeon]